VLQCVAECCSVLQCACVCLEVVLLDIKRLVSLLSLAQGCVCACVGGCVRARTRVHVHVSVCVCLCVCMHKRVRADQSTGLF